MKKLIALSILTLGLSYGDIAYAISLVFMPTTREITHEGHKVELAKKQIYNILDDISYADLKALIAKRYEVGEKNIEKFYLVGLNLPQIDESNWDTARQELVRPQNEHNYILAITFKSDE